MRRLFVITFVATIGLWIQIPEASAETSCPAANPYDNLPDDAALQACLDAGGTITLDSASSPGYFVEVGLVIRHNSTILTAQGPGKARIMAANDLWGPILQTDGFVSGFEISWLNFDGREWARKHVLRGVSLVRLQSLAERLWVRGSQYRITGGSLRIVD